MRVLLCPDSFKGCLDALAVAHAMREGVSRAGSHDAVECPVSDGGEGFTQAIASAAGAELRTLSVTGSHGRSVGVPWCAVDGEAVFTVADIVHLGFVAPGERDPGALTTRGIGEMLLAMARGGAERITVGLGGSGTVDGGVGVALALGFTFQDENGEAFEPVGNTLGRIARIEPPKAHPLAGVSVTVANDVDNPLTGEPGAARVFGPQKGATAEQVEQLDDGLANLQRVCSQQNDHPGDGAAGGLGFGLRVFAGARLTPGSEVVIDAVKLREKMAGADLVITGEGRLDMQSVAGKIAWAVGRLAEELGVPCVCVAGSFGEGWAEAGRVFSRCVRATPEGVDAEAGMRGAESLIAEAVAGLPELSGGR
ncbi:glxK [Symbiodinium necroappetens]|uniref:GlxK protein n=1 Tax=Symbiodinium necroappetens TaxID=1628268 RepID=A0A812XUK1_9DINO|nr:glxK [Symbiodinium necroappetens]